MGTYERTKVENFIISEDVKNYLSILPIDELNIGQEYQRFVELSKVEKIVKEYNPLGIGVILVSKRENGYFIIDGQHRYLALKELQEKEVKCEIVEGITIPEEAFVLCFRANTSRKITPLQMFKALLIMGDSSTVDINNIVKSNMFQINYHGNYKNGINAVSALQQIFKLEGSKMLDRVLKLVKLTWYLDKDAVKQRMLMGLMYFVKLYGSEFADDDFAEKLRDVKPQDIIDAGQYNQKRFGGDPYLCIAKEIWLGYNKKCKKFKLENKF